MVGSDPSQVVEYLDFILRDSQKAEAFRKRYLFETKPDETNVLKLIELRDVLVQTPLCSVVLGDFFKGKRQEKPSKQDLEDAVALVYQLDNMITSLPVNDPVKTAVLAGLEKIPSVKQLLCRNLLVDYITGLSAHISFLQASGVTCPTGLLESIQWFANYSEKSSCNFTQILQQLSQLKCDDVPISDFFHAETLGYRLLSPTANSVLMFSRYDLCKICESFFTIIAKKQLVIVASDLEYQLSWERHEADSKLIKIATSARTEETGLVNMENVRNVFLKDTKYMIFKDHLAKLLGQHSLFVKGKLKIENLARFLISKAVFEKADIVSPEDAQAKELIALLKQIKTFPDI